jgi:hypothetical protein
MVESRRLRRRASGVLDVIRIEMQACEPALNCAHAWRIDAGPDLFAGPSGLFSW